MHDSQQFFYPHAAPSEFTTNPQAFAYLPSDVYIEQVPPGWNTQIPDDVDTLPDWQVAAGLIPSPRIPDDPGTHSGDDPCPPVSGRPVRPRRRKVRLKNPPWAQLISPLFGAVTALTVLAVSVLGWMFTFDPLQDLAATRLPHVFAALWPLMVYGPWLVASLSILRGARERRGAAHSWAVVVAFSCIAVALSVVHATPAVTALIIAGLPQLTAVVSFHQLVRQFSTTQRARHAAATSSPPSKVR
ncbi:DUF2637 domain-containing protein [Actinacidiphila oryziradicis]|uniref:DUF2637 domain-containing protein n=1 Tax=Actinacidiphila oryziradicis TaxID=2571141 RepID=UPI001FE4399B|nr:DUF2637 domain-containing protein [Actinacidiphila oryziradicis]